MLNRLVRVNVGGRRFEALASTLQRYPASHLARLVDSHSAIVDSASSQPDRGSSGPRAAGRRRRAATAAEDILRAEDATGTPTVSDLAALLPMELATRSCTAPDPDGAPSLFLDVDPDAFASVLSFLRTGEPRLPTDNEARRAAVVWQLRLFGLLTEAFPALATATAPGAGSDDPSMAAGVAVGGTDPAAANSGGGGANAAADGVDADVVALPDMLVVQLCDHMQHDQGVKRHAVTMTYGADGFRLKEMCVAMRRDLRTLLSASHWQLYQTHERAAFFVCSRINNGTADLMMTSVSQRLIEHVEKMGYTLASSYVTLSPDVKAPQSARLFMHNFTFRRTRLPVLEDDDLAMAPPLEDDFIDDGDDGEMDSDGGRIMGAPDGDDGPQGNGGPRASSSPNDFSGRQQPEGDEFSTSLREEPDGEEEERPRPSRWRQPRRSPRAGPADTGYVPGGYGYAEGDAEARDAMYRNFEPPALGPQRTPPPAASVPKAQRVARLWPE